jgi:hypothetical protein
MRQREREVIQREKEEGYTQSERDKQGGSTHTNRDD